MPVLRRRNERSLVFRARRRNRGRRDRRGWSAKTFQIKEHEDARDDQERADPFQQPARVAQNLDRTLTEVLRIPGSLRHLVGEPRPGAPPYAGITEWVIHPALAGC